MIKTKNLRRVFYIEGIKRHCQLIHCILLIFLVVAACGNSSRRGSTDKELFVQQGLDILQESKQRPDFSNMETYVIPSGIKYTESRAVDQNNPPILIDISNRNLNLRKFNLSDYYASVRYVKIKHPLPASEGNFLFETRYSAKLKKSVYQEI